MKEFLFGAAGIVLAGAAVAQSQPAPVAQPVAPVPQIVPMPERTHTRSEVVARVREHFAELDSNRDGFLTKDEADAGRQAMKERIRSKLGERRGRLGSFGERGPGAAFDRLDANKDGMISRDEFERGHQQRIERRVVINQAPGAPGRPHQGLRMHRFGGMMSGHMFAMADANKDGRVSLQEATDAAVRHFDMADVNRDGQITPDERRQIRQQFIEKRRLPKAG